MEFKNILVVYDPTTPQQPALVRAASIVRDKGGELRVFAAIHKDIDKGIDRAVEVERLILEQKATLDEAVADIIDNGATVTTEVEWDKDWHSAVVRASIRHNAEVVFKSSYRHRNRERILNRTSDWTLIRECRCPVLLVKEGKNRERRKVLAAVDMRGGQRSYEKLNRNIIGFTRGILDSHSAEVHFVNAYKDLKAYPDRNKLIESCGVNTKHVHIKMGEPEKVIVQGARELDVSMVVVGNSARSGFSAVIDRNTVERVLDKLECDVLSMP